MKSVLVEVGGVYIGTNRENPSGSWRRRNGRRVLEIRDRFGGGDLYVLWELDGGSYYKTWESLPAFQAWVRERIA